MTTKFVEPTNKHVGKTVEVCEVDSQTWKRRELVAVLPEDMRFRFICRCDNEPRQSASWSKARVEIPKTYAELQAESGLKVGDWVKFARKFENGENGYALSWFGSLEKYIGHVGMIEIMEGVENGRGGCVHIDGIPYVLPYFILEKIEKPETKEEKIDKLIRLFKEELVKIL